MGSGTALFDEYKEQHPEIFLVEEDGMRLAEIELQQDPDSTQIFKCGHFLFKVTDIVECYIRHLSDFKQRYQLLIPGAKSISRRKKLQSERYNITQLLDLFVDTKRLSNLFSVSDLLETLMDWMLEPNCFDELKQGKFQTLAYSTCAAKLTSLKMFVHFIQSAFVKIVSARQSRYIECSLIQGLTTMSKNCIDQGGEDREEKLFSGELQLEYPSLDELREFLSSEKHDMIISELECANWFDNFSHLNGQTLSRKMYELGVHICIDLFVLSAARPDAICTLKIKDITKAMSKVSVEQKVCMIQNENRRHFKNRPHWIFCLTRLMLEHLHRYCILRKVKEGAKEDDYVFLQKKRETHFKDANISTHMLQAGYECLGKPIRLNFQALRHATVTHVRRMEGVDGFLMNSIACYVGHKLQTEDDHYIVDFSLKLSPSDMKQFMRPHTKMTVKMVEMSNELAGLVLNCSAIEQMNYRRTLQIGDKKITNDVMSLRDIDAAYVKRRQAEIPTFLIA